MRGPPGGDNCQKRQQLIAFSCKVTVLTLQELRDKHSILELLEEIDGVLIHRLPAEQTLFTLIAQARRQGIPVLFDLDDLLFDVKHAPPPLANYCGNVTPEWHRHCRATQPQIQAMLKAADQLLFSTNTIIERWKALRDLGEFDEVNIQLWPNLIPRELFKSQKRPRMRWLRQQRGQLRVVVASSSTPHRLIWHQQLVPALAQLLEQHPRLQLDLLGTLPLPLILKPFQTRIRCRASEVLLSPCPVPWV